MPRFTNTNSHDIYVRDPDFTLSAERLHPIAPGQTVEASGAFADNLEQTNGVYPGDSYQAAAARAKYPLGEAARANPDGFLAEAAADAAVNSSKVMGTVAPLQEAIGDPDAPRGLEPGVRGRVRDIPDPRGIGEHGHLLLDGEDAVVAREHNEAEHRGEAARDPDAVVRNRRQLDGSPAPAADAVDDDGLEERTLDELRELAREQGREGYSSMKKAQLIELLREERPGDSDADRETND